MTLEKCKDKSIELNSTAPSQSFDLKEVITLTFNRFNFRKGFKDSDHLSLVISDVNNNNKILKEINIGTKRSQYTNQEVVPLNDVAPLAIPTNCTKLCFKVTNTASFEFYLVLIINCL